MGRVSPPPPDVGPFLAKGDDVTPLPRPDAALAQLLEIFSLEIPLPFSIVHPPLWIGQIRPRKDGTKGCHRAEEKKNEALATVALVRPVDAIYN